MTNKEFMSLTYGDTIIHTDTGLRSWIDSALVKIPNRCYKGYFIRSYERPEGGWNVIGEHNYSMFSKA